MKTIYMLRHQKAGIITSHAFTSTPTHAQSDPIIAEAVRVHGKDGWVRIQECQLLDANDVPVFPRRADGDGVASLPEFQINAAGAVTNPKK